MGNSTALPRCAMSKRHSSITTLDSRSHTPRHDRWSRCFRTSRSAMRRTGSARDLGQLPVVARGRERAIVGMLHRSDVVRAYSRAVLNRLETQTHRPMSTADLRGTRVVQVAVDSSGPLDGRTVAELALPRESLLVAIQRGSETFIPRGDTRLKHVTRCRSSSATKPCRTCTNTSLAWRSVISRLMKRSPALLRQAQHERETARPEPVEGFHQSARLLVP